MKTNKITVFVFVIFLISSKTFALNCSSLLQNGTNFASQEITSYNFLKGFYEGYQYPLKVNIVETKNFIDRVYEGCKDSGEKILFNMASAVVLLGSDKNIPDKDLFPEKIRDYGSFSCTSLASTLDIEGRAFSQILQKFNIGIILGRFLKEGKSPDTEDFELFDKIFTQSCGYMDNDRDIAQLSISEILKIKKPKETKIIFPREQTKNSNTEKPNSKNKSATSVPE